jgi:hypothetical protein
MSFDPAGDDIQKGTQEGLGAKGKRRVPSEKISRSEEAAVAPVDLPPRPKPQQFAVKQFNNRVERG